MAIWSRSRPGEESAPEPSLTTKHIVFIDTLRAVAAMTVLVQHIADRMIVAKVAGSEVWHAVFVSLFDAGRFGVGIFFIVSGYVVPFSIREPNAIQAFLIGRFYRLYPVYWLSLLGAYVVLTWCKGISIPFGALAANATMFEMALGVPVLLGPYWTLIIELAFYAACIALYSIGSLRTRLTPWIAMAACLAVCVALTVVGYATGTYLRANLVFNLSLMFYGLAVRNADQRPDAGVKGVWIGALALAACAMIVLLGAPDRSNGMFTPVSFLSGYLAAIAVFLAVRVRRRVPSATLIWLAAISYPIYLLHEIVLLFLEGGLPSGARVETQIAFAIAAVAMTLVFAELAHRWLEEPAIELGRRTAARFRRSPEQASALSTT